MIGAIKNKLQPIINTANSIKAATKKPTTGGGPLGFIIPKVKNSVPTHVLKSFGLKKGGTTTLHSIKKSSKKSNW